MLHLAQVWNNESLGKAELRLLACQRSEYAWMTLNEQAIIPLESAIPYGNGAILLVELSEVHQIIEIRDPKDWLLSFIQTFLLNGITPAFLQEEAERAEQWRQILTLQSQDLDRRALELEARREQIEQLEDSIKREKKQMESLAAQCKEQSQELDQRSLMLETVQDQIDQQRQELDQRALDLAMRQEQIERSEETLKYEKRQMEDAIAEPNSTNTPLTS